MLYKRINIYHTFFMFGLATILFISNLHTIGVLFHGSVMFSNIITIILLIYTIIYLVFKGNLFINKNRLQMSSMLFIFGLTIVYSMSIHSEFDLLVAILFLGLIPSMVLLQIKKDMFKYILIAIIVSLLPILYWIGFGNTLGMMYTLLGVIFYIYINKFKSGNIPNLIILTISFAVIVYLTESRTSLITLMIAILIMPILDLVKKGKNKSKKNPIIILSGIVIFIFIFRNNIKDLIFSKYINSSTNLLTNRTIFWQGTIENGLEPFGNGKYYFINTYAIGNSHNTFIELLGIYGVIPFIMFIFIIVFIFMRAKAVDKEYLVPFFVMFLTMSMAENLLFINTRLVIFVYLLLIFITISVNENDKEFIR